MNDLKPGMGGHLQQIRRLSAILFLVATALVAILVEAPGVDHGHGLVIHLLLAAAALTGVAVWIFPWYRYDPNLFLVVGVSANLMLALLIFWTGGGSSIFFPIYAFVVVASGAYYRTGPLILTVAISCASAASFLLYSGPITSAGLLPLLALLPVLIAVAVICNVMYRGLEQNVLEAAFRARFIETLHQIDLAILNERDEEEVLRVATDRTRLLLGCESARIDLVGSEGRPVEPGYDLESTGASSEGPTLRIPLEARGMILGHLVLAWRGEGPGPEVQVLARNFAAQIALAVQGARLHRQTERLRALTELNRLKDEFISTASHELRTPLTSIVGFSELLARGKVPATSAATTYAALLRSARHLAHLVDDLLDVSRLEAGRLVLSPESRDLVSLVREVSLEMSAVSERHQISVDATDGLVCCSIDEKRVHQVLGNLVSNAIRYSPAGGKITLRVETQGAMAQIQVCDEGIGIPPENLDRIFEKFYRAPNATRTSEATGLGLSVAQGIIQAHGGRIWAQSSGEGRGSCFTFTLPRIE